MYVYILFTHVHKQNARARNLNRIELEIGNENENENDNVATRTGARSNQNWAHTILINRLRLPNKAEQAEWSVGCSRADTNMHAHEQTSTQYERLPMA